MISIKGSLVPFVLSMLAALPIVAACGVAIAASAASTASAATSRAAAPATSPARSQSSAPAGYTRNVAIVLYEGVELLDFAGPGEVFSAAGSQGANKGTRAFHVYTVAASKATLTSQRFLKVTPDYSWNDAPDAHIVVIPGGNSEALIQDPKFMAWIGKTVPKAEISMSVCTGAFVLAKAGFLDGASATTWYGAIDGLRKDAPRTTVIDGRRFVDNGSIITTAGVSAGIDGALHTVARLLGRNVADSTARYMEYHWTPEAYLAQTYSYLNPSLDERGRRLQQGRIFEDEKSFAEAAKAYRALTAEEPKDGFAWYRLGAALQAGGDLDAGIEAARRASASPEVRPDALYNIACAYALQGKKAEAIRALEEAVASGFKAKWQLTGDPDLASLRDDAQFGKLVASL